MKAAVLCIAWEGGSCFNKPSQAKQKQITTLPDPLENAIAKNTGHSRLEEREGKGEGDQSTPA